MIGAVDNRSPSRRYDRQLHRQLAALTGFRMVVLALGSQSAGRGPGMSWVQARGLAWLCGTRNGLAGGGMRQVVAVLAAGAYHRHRYQGDRCAEQQDAEGEQGEGEPGQVGDGCPHLSGD